MIDFCHRIFVYLVDKKTTSLILCLIFIRTPSKQKSPKKDEEVDIVELLRGHDPKDYERILQEHGIHDYRAILQAVEFLKREKEMETGKVVRKRNWPRFN